MSRRIKIIPTFDVTTNSGEPVTVARRLPDKTVHVPLRFGTRELLDQMLESPEMFELEERVGLKPMKVLARMEREFASVDWTKEFVTLSDENYVRIERAINSTPFDLRIRKSIFPVLQAFAEAEQVDLGN
jgi:hypothetical protein